MSRDSSWRPTVYLPAGVVSVPVRISRTGSVSLAIGIGGYLSVNLGFSRKTIRRTLRVISATANPPGAVLPKLTGFSNPTNMGTKQTLDDAYSTDDDASIDVSLEGDAGDFISVDKIDDSGAQRSLRYTRKVNYAFSGKFITVTATRGSRTTTVSYEIRAGSVDGSQPPPPSAVVRIEGVPSRIDLGANSSHTESYTTSERAAISFEYEGDAAQYIQAFVGDNSGTTRTFHVTRISSASGAGQFSGKYVVMVATVRGITSRKRIQITGSELPFRWVGLPTNLHIESRFNLAIDHFDTTFGPDNSMVREINANDSDYLRVVIDTITVSGTKRFRLRVYRQGTYGNADFSRYITLEAKMGARRITQNIRITSDAFDSSAPDPNNPPAPPDTG